MTPIINFNLLGTSNLIQERVRISSHTDGACYKWEMYSFTKRWPFDVDFLSKEVVLSLLDEEIRIRQL